MGRFDYFPTIYYAQRDLRKNKKNLRYPPFKYNCDNSMFCWTLFRLYTSSFDSAGRITDPCEGDSGGPLFIERGGQWELVGVLKVTVFYRMGSN